MPSGFKVGSTDLDSLFATRSGSSPASATGFLVSGTDINDRYHASTGGDQIGSSTGYKVGGADLKSLFRDISYSPPPPPVPPTITGGTVTTGPYSFNVGDYCNFTVTATGDPTLTYQWKKDGVDISGATSSSYSFTASSPSESGTYSVVVTNGAGSDSASASLTISDIVPAITGGTVTGGPYTLSDGNVANFTVTATGTNLTYQWYKDAVAIGGATASSYIFTAHLGDDGTYSVTVTNSAGSDSASASLTVVP